MRFTSIKSSSTPWSYRRGTTLLHRMPAGLKLISLLIFSFAAFFPGTTISSLLSLAIIALLLFFLSLIACINPITLLRGSGPLFMIILAVFLFQAVEFFPPGINFEGLTETIIFCIRIAAAFAAGSLLFSVTTPGEIRKSLSRLETLLHIRKLNLGLGITLMLGFLPRFFVVWEEINLAWESRSGKKNLSRLLKLIPLMAERMMIHAAETASAMESRGLLL